MNDPRCFDARLIWFQCGDCGAKLQESQRRYHNNQEHVSRPHDDAMTIVEVAKVLGVTPWVVRRRIKAGKIQRFDDGATGRGARMWVLKADLRRYVRTVASKPEAMVQWANTGKLDDVNGQDK